MRSAILFVLLVAFCVAEDTIKYGGTTANGATFAIPTWSSGACAPAATANSPYVLFNVTYATAGVREVAAMAEQAYKGSIRIYIYLSTFDPANPCTNALGDSLGQQTGLDGGPVIDDYVYFTAATYQFVVTADSGSTGGLFAVNIFPSLATGVLTGGPNATQWAYPQLDSDGACYSDPTEPTPIGWYTWTQATTGYFDILATFANSTFPGDYFYATLALFQGVPSLAGLAEDPCNTTETGATFITVVNDEYRGALLAYANLTAGWNYTVVVSSTSGNTGYWGLQVIPTRIRFFHNSNFVQPERESGQNPDCSPSSDDTAGWDSTLFTTELNTRVYLIDTQEPPAPFTYVDTYSFLYRGDNTGTDANPPATCPLFAPLVIMGDTGDITPVYATTDPGVNYTAVVSTYSGSQPVAGGAYVLYLFTGQPIGSLPPSTTGVPTTTGGSGTTSPTPTGGSGTTSPTPATGSSSGVPTGTGGTTSTTNKPVTTSTTSSASIVAVGVVAVVAAVASLL